jgi:hypothetical protein
MHNPSIYQINTRIILQERGVALGRPATFEDLETASSTTSPRRFSGVVPRRVADRPGRAAISDRTQADGRVPSRPADLRDEDITGSPFAIVAYETCKDFGNDRALRSFASACRAGVEAPARRLPNHGPRCGRSIPVLHPGQRGHRPPAAKHARVGSDATRLAFGRDPYFDGWPDTFQLNYRHAGFREARIAELGSIADRCDGVRCDMAMLLQPQIIQKTWGDRSRPADGTQPKDNPFWPEAIGAIRRRHPGFLFVAEVYWDMEWELQQAGFDYTYDKRLYDRLVIQTATPVREHLMADPSFQDRSRFENHDEPRAV